MRYGIYWQDHNGNELPTKTCSTIFESIRKANAYCKLLNEHVKVKSLGKFVVVDL